jgi:TPP-dependent pyruvate/acetoin dehydrogenase alpha subunit
MDYKKEVIKNIIRIRIAQLLVNERYKIGDFKIPIHLAFGHESLAVAVDTTIENDDSLVLSHRNIHYNIARMDTFKEIMDEYYLKDSGVACGHLGSMNLSNTKNNIVYTSSILGNNLPVSTGFALGNKLYKNSRVVFVVTGDGAIEEGSFYESLVFMKSNNLNIVIIIENNQWSLGTMINERRSPIDLKILANSLDIDYLSLNGNDPFEYIKKVSLCRAKSVENNSPILIEVDLTTLGYWHKVTQDYPKGKYINYHAGPASNFKMEKYPLISLSDEDPLFVLKKYISDIELNNISSRILKQLESEVL